MRKHLLTLAALAASILMLAGCGDSQQPAVTAPATPPVPYQVKEKFNVGEGIYVRSLAVEKASNSLWVGTSVGVLQVSLNSKDLLNTYTRQHGLANEYVFKIFIDSKGNKWFGTDGGGMSRFRDGQWETFFPLHGLADYWIYAFAEQDDGTLWIGTWKGLNAMDGKTGAFKTYLEELVNEWVYGLDIDAKGRIWIGTEGGVNMFDGSKWSTWTHEHGLGAPNGQGLSVSPNTGLGTRSRHDLSVMSSGAETYNPNYIFDTLAAKDGTVWAGTWGGGVSRFDGKKWTNFTTKEGLAGNIVYSIAQGADGTIWFGTNHGVSSFDGKHWQTLRATDGLIDDNVYDIAIDPKGDVWVGTRGGVAQIGR